ncbi:GAF and ANTAR domain-containing protein [Kribbella sp. NBC_01245]|uniref:GAF and ANTAR domain-containing protein n=1 Tax=Kribbella sp. NBC_01245 TaxID=2903578 RepID=UPI002E2A4803|nr:GAF and ANTAR domain-containing protein [Kribbella sp. NBC_01245]
MSLTRTEDHQPLVADSYRDSSGTPEADVMVAAGFAQLAVELYDAADMAETVDRVLQYALRATGCDCAGVVMAHRGTGLQTVGVTDRRGQQADRLQLQYGEGPCVPVNWEHHTVLVCDTAVDGRWPRWSPEVAELGLRSVLTVWLFTTRSTLGALNLYGIHPGQFSAVDETNARLLARHASVAVATVREASTLAQAVAARTLIGQAQGLLMERFAIDADQAFAVLRRYSQDNNVKLRIVADELVSTRRLPPEHQPVPPTDLR